MFLSSTDQVRMAVRNYRTAILVLGLLSEEINLRSDDVFL